MDKKWAAILSLTVVSIVIVSCFFVCLSDNDVDSSGTADVVKSSLYTYQNEWDASDVSSKDSVLIIDNPDSLSLDKETISQYIIEGVPIVSVCGTSFIREISSEHHISTCFDNQAQCCAIYRDGAGTSYCISWDSPDDIDTVVSDWLDKSLHNTIDIGRVTTPFFASSSWAPCVISTRDVHSPWGSYSIHNDYYCMADDSVGLNWYVGMNWVKATPEDGRCIDSIQVHSSVADSGLDCVIWDYSPSADVDGPSFIVNLNPFIADYERAAWRYNVEDITVHNNSNTGKGFVDLTHDFNKKSDSSKTARIIAPGHLVFSAQDDEGSEDGNYAGTDSFTVSFAKKARTTWEQLFGDYHWQYDSSSTELCLNLYVDQ